MKYLMISLSLLMIFELNSCQSYDISDDATGTPSENVISPVRDIPNNGQEGLRVDGGAAELENVAVEKESPVVKVESDSASPPPLSDLEIEKIILETTPDSFAPVLTDNGRIMIIYRDLDQNGYRDAFFLVVKNRENLDSEFDSLSDVSILLKNDSEPVDFFLSVYLQLQGGMVSMFRIPVGSSVVLSDFSVVTIEEDAELPLGINISFQTVKGTDREWIIFSSYNKFSLFSMTENISEYSYSYDIDGDKIIDIVDWEDGLEEGTGYETYLTWYKWNGREYREYLSTNIVRNLNGFLEQARLYLSFDQLEQFFIHSLSTDDYSKFKESGANYSEWLDLVFRPVPGSGSDQNEFLNCDKLRSVVFPQIFENPFVPGNISPHICNINVRFECDDGYSFIRTARIQMNRNPFHKPQFSFYLE